MIELGYLYYFNMSLIQIANRRAGCSGNRSQVLTRPAFHPVQCGAPTGIWVSTLQGKSTEGGGKAAKANIDVKSRGEVRLPPGMKSMDASAKGAKWLLS